MSKQSRIEYRELDSDDLLENFLFVYTETITGQNKGRAEQELRQIKQELLRRLDESNNCRKS